MFQSASRPSLCIAEGVASTFLLPQMHMPNAKSGAKHSSSALAYTGDIWDPGGRVENGIWVHIFRFF